MGLSDGNEVDCRTCFVGEHKGEPDGARDCIRGGAARDGVRDGASDGMREGAAFVWLACGTVCRWTS
jgi:hypothetical protein